METLWLDDRPGDTIPGRFVPGLRGAPFLEFSSTLSGKPWRIVVRDSDTNTYLGEIDQYQSATFIPRFNDVGSWTIAYRGDSRSATSLFESIEHPGIALIRGTTVLMSGPLDSLTRTYDPSGDIYTATGSSDVCWLYDRITHPNPSVGESGPNDNYTLWESASVALHQCVYDHCIQTALGREVPMLQAAPPSSFGPVILNVSRYVNLLTIMQEIANPIPLAFDIRNLNFTCWVPQNFGITFAIENGSITSYKAVVSKPQWNTVYGGGVGADHTEVVVVEQDAASVAQWNRIESFLSRTDIKNPPDTGTPTLETVTEAQVTAGAVPTGYTVVARDVPGQEFGVDYGVGDIVTVSIPGVTYTDIIRSVTISFTNNGPVTVVPTVGYPAKTSTLIQLGRLSREVRRLQTT